jgi:hypothetical protein
LNKIHTKHNKQKTKKKTEKVNTHTHLYRGAKTGRKEYYHACLVGGAAPQIHCFTCLFSKLQQIQNNA